MYIVPWEVFATMSYSSTLVKQYQLSKIKQNYLHPRHVGQIDVNLTCLLASTGDTRKQTEIV